MVTNIVIFVILIILKSVTSTILNVNVAQVNKIFHGRYTRDVNNAELIIPRHVHQDGKFKSFALPNFYSRNEINERRKRSSSFDKNADKLHLILPFNGKDHHIELDPYHDFISPEMIIEIRSEGTGSNITKGLRFKRATDEQCHYRGVVRDHHNSRVALSLCDGVAGYVLTNDGRFFIEPLNDSVPGNQGQHIHMIYKRHAAHEEKESKEFCGTGDDWESAWTEQLIKRERKLNDDLYFDELKRENRRNVSSSTHSIHRYIEIGLVADLKFLEFWKGTDIDRYLLTIMNMVADFYHDATVGNQIDVIVVRMIYLEAEKEEMDLDISPNSEVTLDTFSQWAYKINPKDPKHPYHFDIGVLVTRHDICSERSQCNLMGLAYVATACDPKRAAALCEDSGLLLGIVIAHEVGHVMGCSHDKEDISGCPPMDVDKSYFIMSPVVFIYTLRWSTCSRRFISNLLNSGLGDCLIDDPKNPQDKFQYPNMLPGAMYDGNFQCDMEQPGTFACQLSGSASCNTLWCQQGEDCYSDEAPPAEGTKCGENKWCIKQQCVRMGQRPRAIHGGWGEWGPEGECSRSCGGGVKISERECDNPTPSNGGRYCIGERRRIHVCNSDPCNPRRPSFRAIQCIQYDSKQVLSDGLHHWEPYYRKNLDECKLHCLNELNAYVTMGLVEDATPCKRGTKNMCVAGVCRTVGCDWEIDSGAIEDQCGICKGDGTQCSVIEGQFTESKPIGYTKIVTIPKNSKNINIMENKLSENVLAVKYENSDKYCLNGNYHVNYVGEFDCAGSRLIFKQPQYHQEEIEIKGPITDDIQIQILFLHDHNPGVSYKYIVPKSELSEYKPKYYWDFIQWSDCDVNCGGGTMIMTPNCIEEKSGIVSDSFCNDLPRLSPKARICNDHPCPIKWRVSQWSKCSACKGHQGEKTRKVQCVKSAARSNGDDVEVDLKDCKGSPPLQTMKCDGTKSCKKSCHPKSKITAKRNGNASPLRESDLIDSSDIDRNENNKNYEDELKNIHGEMITEHKEKRLCDEHETTEIEEMQTTEQIPISITVTEECPMTESTTSETETVASTTETDIKVEICDDELTSRSVTESQQEESTNSGSDTEIKPLSTIEPGTLIKDENPSDNAVLLEAPIKDDSSKVNMSDIAYEEIDDSAPIQIDTSREKIYTGPEARKRIIEMAYGNVTDITESQDSDIIADNFVE